MLQASIAKHRVILQILLLLFAATADARTRQVFFAGGQSNAKAGWASAIEGVLKANCGPDVMVVHQNHPGNWLNNWYTTQPQANYTNDFFNSEGTGYLQSQLQAIKASGDDYVFKGLFWFQGECDAGSDVAINAYAGVFFAMLNHLREDLQMTNNLNFTMAIIDLNPNPYYDNPTNVFGQTRAALEKMRANQFNIASTSFGSYVDTRGYTRSDAWHLLTSELHRLGTNMANAYVSRFGLQGALYDSQFFNGGFESGTGGSASGWSQINGENSILPSNAADGTIFEMLGTSPGFGAFPSQDLIIGPAAGPANYNGIAFFPLPAQTFTEASLELTAVSKGVLPNANIDVWGLGYVTGTPVMNPNWLLSADNDVRVGSEMGTGIGTNTPTKISDNFVTQGTIVNEATRWQTSVSQSSNLLQFLNSLYANGAMPGDYAVIRVNPDADMAAVLDGAAEQGFQNIRFGGSHRAPDQQCKLFLTVPPLLIAERSSLMARSGTAAFRFGLDEQHHGTNFIGISQDLDTGNISERRVTMSGHSWHSSTSALLSNQQIEFQFLCKNAAGDVLATANTAVLNSASICDLDQVGTLSSIAPMGTVRVTLQIIFRAADFLTQTAGMAFVDDLAVSISPAQEPEFQITRMYREPNGDVRLSWASISNRQYVVQATSNWLTTPFTDVSGTNTASTSELTYTHHPTDGARYYRVRRLP